MKYEQPYGVSDPNAPYINGNPSTGTMGSIPPAASIENPQREIVELIADAGLTPDSADLKQLAKGIQSQRVNFGVDVGTVNNLQVTLAPVPVYKNGLMVRVLAVQSNTGPAVLNVNAIGPKKIRRAGDTDLLANDITAGSTVTVVYNEVLQAGAGAWELQGVGGIGAGGYMTGNLDLYVNDAIGNDSNDGSDPTAAHAVRTIQRAINIAFNYRPSQYTLTIHIADSLNYGACKTPQWSGPNLSIVGNVATPANVTVTAQAGQHAFEIYGLNTVSIAGVKVQTVVGGNHLMCGFQVWPGAQVTTSNTESGYCDYAVFQVNGGTLANADSHRFNGGCGTGMVVSDNQAYYAMFSCTYTIVSPISAPYFALASFGLLQFNAANCPFVNPGNFTGQKYLAQYNGIISTLGGGANYFPGNIAGSVNTGGQYA